MWLPKLMLRFMSQALQRCIVTFHLFSLLYQRTSGCWKYWKWCSYFENHYHNEKMVEKNTINVLVSPYCTLLFSRKENIKFSKVVLIAAHCNCLISWFMIAWISALKYYSGYLLAYEKTAIKTLYFLSSILEQLTVVVLKSF